jgi:RNA polymerase sigma-70 factor (ECF subfamily)
VDEADQPIPLRARPASGAPGAAGGEDDELVRRALAGDERAWARLYQRHFDRIFRDVAYLIGAGAGAEEIVQDTFAAALTGLGRFDGRSSFVTWLRGIAHNLVRRYWRTNTRRDRAYDRLAQVSADAPTPINADPEGAHIQDRRAEVLRAVLEAVPDALREAFILCDVQGLSANDAAERLGISVGNVRVRASRARAVIRGELERMGWLEPGGTSS